MPSPDLDFEFYVGGIEDEIIRLLKIAMEPLGVREFDTYSGSLEDEQVKKAIASEERSYPLVLVTYSDGVDQRMPGRSAVLGRSLSYRHDCTFAVICVDDNPQGEQQRRRSKIYQMLSAVRNELTGRRLKIEVEDDEVLLTHDILEPESNEWIARLPDLTAYAVIFKTYFKWSSPDRTVDGTPVEELVLGVDSENSETVQTVNNLPGVLFETE